MIFTTQPLVSDSLVSATANCSGSRFPLSTSTKGFEMSCDELDIVINDM